MGAHTNGTSNGTSNSVTVIGLGPMGQAMAAAYLDQGYEVTLWNRTPSRAADLVGRGAVLAPTVEAALAVNELVVLSLIDYDAMYTTFAGVPDTAFAGRVLVNLSSDTPDKARAAAAWVAERGAVQLTGGVTVPPYELAKPGASTFYSGPAEAVEAHRAALEVLTAVDYKGADPGLAALHYQLGMTVFWTAMLSFWQAVAMAEAHGLSAADVLPHSDATLTGMGSFLEFYAKRVDAGDHTGDVDRLAMARASVDHVLHTASDAGVDTTLPGAVLALIERGMDAGHGADSFSSLVELMKRQR
ncbi:NAD(P)-dependent oxidoreductase [Streptomyces sp. NPDC050504]|uniref:NAD(P)-dependent oxidoreductase n=1 Tax=Streptomyces sp. NPDC050504 TaxID=3365618 RepID=UPI0037B7DC38